MPATNKIPRTCENCGVVFKRTPSYFRKISGRFCSRACFLKNRWKEMDERFWRYVEKTDTCWLWRGVRQKQGYGLLRTTENGKQINHVAHRVSYEIANGPIPKGKVICHKCDNPPCVNPDHLFLGTTADNIADCVSKGRTARGTRNTKAKLNEHDVRDIRRRFNARAYRGDGLVARLTKEYGIDRTSVHHIITGKTWKHVQ